MKDCEMRSKAILDIKEDLELEKKEFIPFWDDLDDVMSSMVESYEKTQASI